MKDADTICSHAGQSPAVRLLMLGLAAMVRADFGSRPSEAAPFLRGSATHLGVLGKGDPERINLVGHNWAVADVAPETAEGDRYLVSEQIAELVPAWFS